MDIGKYNRGDGKMKALTFFIAWMGSSILFSIIITQFQLWNLEWIGFTIIGAITGLAYSINKRETK